MTLWGLRADALRGTQELEQKPACLSFVIQTHHFIFLNFFAIFEPRKLLLKALMRDLGDVQMVIVGLDDTKVSVDVQSSSSDTLCEDNF